jgi:hypothetical protein
VHYALVSAGAAPPSGVLSAAQSELARWAKGIAG